MMPPKEVRPRPGASHTRTRTHAHALSRGGMHLRLPGVSHALLAAHGTDHVDGRAEAIRARRDELCIGWGREWQAAEKCACRRPAGRSCALRCSTLVLHRRGALLGSQPRTQRAQAHKAKNRHLWVFTVLPRALTSPRMAPPDAPERSPSSVPVVSSLIISTLSGTDCTVDRETVHFGKDG